MCLDGTDNVIKARLPLAPVLPAFFTTFSCILAFPKNYDIEHYIFWYWAVTYKKKEVLTIGIKLYSIFYKDLSSNTSTL